MGDGGVVRAEKAPGPWVIPEEEPYIPYIRLATLKVIFR